MKYFNEELEKKQKELLSQICDHYNDFDDEMLKEKMNALSMESVRLLFGLDRISKDIIFQQRVLNVIKKEKWLDVELYNKGNNSQYVSAFMHDFAKNLNPQKIKLYLKAGADINIQTSPELLPPLFYALIQGLGYKEFIEWGANIGYVDKNGYSSIMMALKSELKNKPQKEMLDYLVTCGADLNVKASRGVSTFMLACNSSPDFALDLLHKVGSQVSPNPYIVDIHEIDQSGFNALAYLVLGFEEYKFDEKRNHHLELLTALWKGGVDLKKLYQEGSTAITMAGILQKPTITNLLKQFEEADKINNFINNKPIESSPTTLKKPVL